MTWPDQPTLDVQSQTFLITGVFWAIRYERLPALLDFVLQQRAWNRLVKKRKDMQNQEFAGAFKTNTSFLSPLERRLAPVVLRKIPDWLETHHLTMLTLVWSLLILAFSYLAATDIRWLWLVSLMICFQYLTDYYDGKIGKYRNTGLLRWGYYMDHLLDYFFLSSVIIGYAFILPEKSRLQLLLMLTLFGAYDLSTFLAFAATDRLKISYLKFGPTEFRLALIVINTLLILFGTRYMISSLKFVNAGAAVGLALLVYQTHKQIWQLDMEHKHGNLPGEGRRFK